MIDPEPVVVLYKNRINPTNRYWKKYTQRDETQRESLRGKNAIVFTRLSENRLHSARPENALHLNSTLARMPFYDRAYPEKHWSVSPGIPVVLMKRSLSLIFVPLDEKSSEESTSLEGNYYLTIIANKFLRKVRSKYQLEKKPINIHFAWNVPQLNWHASLWGKLNVLNFWYCRKILENYFFQKIFDQKLGKFFSHVLNATNFSYPITLSELGHHTWDIRPEICVKATLAVWKNLGFHLFSPKRAEEKLPVPFNYYLANGANQYANRSYVCAGRKRASKSGKAVGNGENQTSFEKSPRFFLRQLAEKIGKKTQRVAQPDGVQSISANAKAFLSLLQRQD